MCETYNYLKTYVSVFVFLLSCYSNTHTVGVTVLPAKSDSDVMFC